MTNKLIEEAVEEFRGWKRLLNEFHLPEERPEKEGDMAELWLRDKLTTLLTKQLTEFEWEVKGKEKKVPAAFGLGNNPGKAAMRGEKIGYNQAIDDTLTLIAEQKELLAKDKCVIN